MKSNWEAHEYPSSLAYEEAKQAGDPAVASGRLGRDEPTRAETHAETQAIEDMDPGYTSDKASRNKPSRMLEKRGGHKTTPIPMPKDGKGFRRLIGIIIAVVAIGGSALEDLDLEKVVDDFFSGLNSGFNQSSEPSTESGEATQETPIGPASGPFKLDDNSVLYTTATKPENQISYIYTDFASIHLAAEVASNNSIDPVIIETDQIVGSATSEVRLDITEEQNLVLQMETDGEIYEPLLQSTLPQSEVGKRFFEESGKLKSGVVVEVVLADINEDSRYDFLVLYDDYVNKTVLEAYTVYPYGSRWYTYCGYVEADRYFLLDAYGHLYDNEEGRGYYQFGDNTFKKQ